jgi:NitT/TauT family transport system permease protein
MAMTDGHEDIVTIVGDPPLAVGPHKHNWVMRHLLATRRLRRVLTPLIPLAVLGGLWQLLAGSRAINPTLYGEPLDILKSTASLLGSNIFYQNLLSTVEGTLGGFVIGSLGGIAIAIAMSRYRFLDDMINPWVAMLNSMPRIALAPLFVLWLGLGLSSKIVTAITLVIFITLTNTLAGLRVVDNDQLRLCRSLGFTEGAIYWRLRLPSALPSIFAGLRLGLAYTLLGVVGAEMIAAKLGLGILIVQDANAFDTSGVFAVLLVVMVLALVFVGALDMVERRVLAWADDSV